MHRHRWRPAAAAGCLLLVLFAGLPALPGTVADPPPATPTPGRAARLSLAARGPAAESPPKPPAPAPVKLAVLVVFDQLRGDYLTRWDDLFEEGGFRRLDRDGAWFQNCH